MSIEAVWDNPNETIIRQTFTGEWDWTEFHQNTREVIQDSMLRSKPYPVDVICDFRHSANLPIGSSALTHARSVMLNVPENQRLVIIVSNSPFIRALVNTFGRIYRPTALSQVLYADSLEDAYALIERVRVAAAD